MGKNKEKIKKKVIQFLKRYYKKFGTVPSGRVIYKKLKVDVWSHFKGGLREIYRLCNFGFSPEENKQKSRKELYFQKRNRIRKKILKYFVQQIKKGTNPTASSIRERFHISLLTYFPGGIREIVKLAGIKYYRKFASKTPEEKELTKQKIIKYAIQKLRNGFYPGYRDVESKFHINFQHYFKNPEELYQKAGYNGPVKKTHKNSGTRN